MPHRMFSGKCRLSRWVANYFEPYKEECQHCINMVNMECEVVEGIEQAVYCPELRNFIEYEGIKLYGRAKAALDKAQGKDKR